MSNPPPNSKISQIPHSVADTGSLVNATQSLKQAVDSLAGFRGGPLDRAVTFHDIIRLGLADETTITSPSGATDFATNSSLTASIDGISGSAHTWTQEQIISVGDNQTALFIKGTARAARYYETTTSSVIEGRDNANTVYDPMTIGGSEVRLSVSGVDSLVVKGTGATLGAPTGGALGAGILNAASGLAINGTQLQTTATSYQASPANAAGTIDTTGVMMGYAGAITPSRSGKVLIIISGNALNSISGDGAVATLYTGTGTAPVNGAALTGTPHGAASLITTAAAGQTVGFSVQAIVSGLTVGTPIWIDLALAARTGGTATVINVSLSAVEL